MASKSSFHKDCQDYFGTTNLYKVLHLCETDDKDADTQDISQAQSKRYFYSMLDKNCMRYHTRQRYRVFSKLSLSLQRKMREARASNLRENMRASRPLQY
jgi:hypothetical protein